MRDVGTQQQSLTAPPRAGRSLWKRLFSRPPVRHVARYERVLGTALELQVVAETPEPCRAAEAAVLREIDRLEGIFSAYRPDSELRRWLEAPETGASPAAVSPELAAVLEASEYWRERTAGAFHPAAEALTRLWRAAAEQGSEPDPAALERTVADLRAPLWEVDRASGTATRWTRLPVTLNAAAKGFILDCACETAMRQPGVRAALVNIGGDIRQRGGQGVPVGIADPFAPHENARLLGSVWLHQGGIATSGGYRRGFPVGERWRSHVLDPRTGYPVEQVVSASVVADTALLADILATVFSVLPPEESIALADALPGIGTLLVAQDGARHENAAWRRHAAASPDRI